MHGPNYARLPAELVDGEDEEWEVERIIGHRKRGHGQQYHVLWKGYPISKATWELESAFEHTSDTLQVVFGSPVLGLKKDCNWTGPGPVVTSHDRFGVTITCDE